MFMNSRSSRSFLREYQYTSKQEKLSLSLSTGLWHLRTLLYVLCLVLHLLCFMALLQMVRAASTSKMSTTEDTITTLFSSPEPQKSSFEPNATLILMNHARPQNVLRLVPPLLEIPRISQIIISHTHPDSRHVVPSLPHHPAILHRFDDQTDRVLGLATRFMATANATNKWTIFLDDDVLPSKAAFALLMKEFAKDTARIVGKWGRTFQFGPLYDTFNCAGHCPVVLTKFMIMRTDAVQLFFAYAHNLGMPVGLRGGGPRWNGEDIFMSLAYSHFLRGKKHYAMPSLRTQTLRTSTKQPSVSARWTWRGLTHWWHRGYLWTVTLMRMKSIQ